MSDDPRSRSRSNNVLIQHQAYSDGIPGKLPRRRTSPTRNTESGASRLFNRHELPGLPDGSTMTIAAEQMARLDISRHEATPSPSPSYTRRAGSRETPSVTSQSEGEEDEAGETSGFGSGLIRKKTASTSVLKAQHHVHHPGRESSIDTLEDETDGTVSQTVLEKAWGPAPTKRRTRSWLSLDPDRTPGYEAPDQLHQAGNQDQGEEIELDARSGGAEGSEAGEEKRSIADDLPPEIILQILGHLTDYNDINNVLYISRIWCQCTIPLIWTRPNIHDERSLRGLIRILRLSTGRGKDILYKSTNTTFPYHLLIKRLYFCTLGTRLQDEHVIEFAQCEALEKIAMKGNKYVSPRALTQLVKGKDKLVVVDIGETRVDDQVLMTLGRDCPELVGLSIPDCHHFTPLGLITFANSEKKKLRRIKLSRSIGVDSESISALVKACPSLLEIELSGSQDVTDSALIDIWLHAGRLREIDLKGSDKLTAKGFPVLSELKTIDDQSFPPEHPDHMSSPRESDSKTVPPEADYSVFSSIPRAIPASLNLSTLRVVDMESCSGLTDAAIDALTWNARWIRAITLAKCSQLTDASLLSLCRLGKHLHHVHLGYVPKVTDWGVCKLARGCNRLRYIDLAGDSLLSDLSVFELAANCPKLKRVGLVRVAQLTDAAISALVDRSEEAAANLERLHLSYCDNISVKAITHLLKGARNITHLSLTDVSAFKQPEFQRLAQPVPEAYTSGQRAAFCVFTRDGVIKLRKWLTAKEDQRSPFTWRDSTVERTTSESLSHYHSRQRAAAMAWLGSPPTEREPRAPLAEMMAATSSTSDFGVTLGANPVTLNEEPVASRNTVPFHRNRLQSIGRPTPLYARTPQGRIPSLNTTSLQSTASTANRTTSSERFTLQPGGTSANSSSTVSRGSRSSAQTTRSTHLDSMLEDIQHRRNGTVRQAQPSASAQTPP